MSNPYLPKWEYIPDGEPRVFGDRIYVYGSHDRVCSDAFCDFKLKVWSAPLDNLNEWVCHGDCFHTRTDINHQSDTPWTENELYAPDVVEKDGKYYLYAYIVNAKGCVAVSDKPEGPFELLSQYKYDIENHYDNGTFIDPGVLVDDDGKVYVYCGFLGSYMAQIDENDMYSVINDTYKLDIIPKEEPFSFFEACSPRKVGDTYYMIYSPNIGSRLVYATSKSPFGPFEYGGVIVDNGVDYPGGNNHGSICNINGQWYIFYHRMTNGTIMSRRACVERIEILPDGTIPQVEMTSLGFEKSLNPYKQHDADIACVLKNGCFVNEKNPLCRSITNITDGCIIGYKYFDFGDDFSNTSIKFYAKINGLGAKAKMHILIDNDTNVEEIGVCEIGLDSGVVSANLKCVNGVHSIFFRIEACFDGCFKDMFKGRALFELESFVFTK